MASLLLEMGNTHQAIVYYEKLLALKKELQVKHTYFLCCHLISSVNHNCIKLFAVQTTFECPFNTTTYILIICMYEGPTIYFFL